MRRRILVTDNDREWLDLIALDLGLEGHEIVGQAASGEQAIELCETLRPDVLVVDQRMPPGIDGLGVVARLRATQPELAVIVFSNHEDHAAIAAAEAAGARFVLKTNLRALRKAVLEA